MTAAAERPASQQATVVGSGTGCGPITCASWTPVVPVVFDEARAACSAWAAAWLNVAFGSTIIAQFAFLASIIARLVVVLADPKSEHELVGDVVGDDPFKLIKRLSGLRFLVDEAKTAGPNLRHSDGPWGCITGGIGDQANCVGGRVGRVQGQRDGNSALLECLRDLLHDNVVEGGHLLSARLTAKEASDLRAVIPGLGVAGRDGTLQRIGA